SLGVIALVLTVSIWLSMRKQAVEELAAAQRGEAGSDAASRRDGAGADGPAVPPDTAQQSTHKPGAPS
ncbi:MAG TPA: hypothetical protein VHK25_04190, partial [Acidimicrobiales bacterium]|nr:hypothetical protein [Acidimicrobiales bacterium]